VTGLTRLAAAIGGPPSADAGLDLDSQKISLHDDFIADPVDPLMPGGAPAVIIRDSSLDRWFAVIRERIVGHADHPDAIRSPSDAFTREGSAVTTDAVFLRKRAPGQEPERADPEWPETPVIGIAAAGSSYLQESFSEILQAAVFPFGRPGKSDHPSTRSGASRATASAPYMPRPISP
jgi:hypothetical protein